MNKEKGFTLIELLVVVVIIALLAAFGLNKYRSVGESENASDHSEAVVCEDGYRVLREKYSTRQLYGADGSPQRCTAKEN